MAGFDASNILGAVSEVSTGFSGPKSLKKFLKNIDKYGVQVKNNFEINFSGFGNLTFFATSINMPNMIHNFTEIYYNGRSIKIPLVYDFEHSFSITVINDASGVLYPLFSNFLMSSAADTLVNSGFKMIIKCLTGDKSYRGMQVTFRNVKIESVSGLSFGQSENDISTFDVILNCLDYTVTPGGLIGKTSNIFGTVNSLLG